MEPELRAAVSSCFYVGIEYVVDHRVPTGRRFDRIVDIMGRSNICHASCEFDAGEWVTTILFNPIGRHHVYMLGVDDWIDLLVSDGPMLKLETDADRDAYPRMRFTTHGSFQIRGGSDANPEFRQSVFECFGSFERLLRLHKMMSVPPSAWTSSGSPLCSMLTAPLQSIRDALLLRPDEHPAKALFIDPASRSVQPVGWDLALVRGLPLSASATSWSEGVDGRNHVLACVLLDRHIGGCAAHTVSITAGVRYVVWLCETMVDERTEAPAFRLNKVNFFDIPDPAILVAYTHAEPNKVKSDSAAADVATEKRLRQEAVPRDVDAGHRLVAGISWLTSDRTLTTAEQSDAVVSCNRITGSIETLFRCSFCRELKSKLMVCGRCRAAKYCSPECQRTDWSSHKKTCVGGSAIQGPPRNVTNT